MLIDKAMLLVCCMTVMAQRPGALAPLPLLVGICVSALAGYFDDRRFTGAVALGYGMICIFAPEFCVFLPLVFYDVAIVCPWPVGVALGTLSLAGPLFSADLLGIMTVLFMGLGWVLRQRTLALERAGAKFNRMRDDSRELALLLEQRNKELLEKQDYEIRLATLNERNRIAREIHDHVGHMLSRSILQVGALMALHREQPLNGELNGVRDTLSQAMDNIRASVHDLHDESIDLQIQLGQLLRDFSFCPVSFVCDVQGRMAKEVQYCFIMIVKEALSNVMRHSDATQVRIEVIEHPALYQLIVQDNGSPQVRPSKDGLGLKNMAERVAALEGNLLISRENGYRIFVSVPRQRIEEG